MESEKMKTVLRGLYPDRLSRWERYLKKKRQAGERDVGVIVIEGEAL